MLRSKHNAFVHNLFRRGKVVLLAVAFLGGCADTGVMMRSARAQQHSAVVLAYLDTLHNRQEPAQAAHLYLAPVFHDHAPGVSAAGRIEILRTVAQGDLVTVHLRAVSAAGEPHVAFLELYRLYQGKIVDRWAMSGPEEAP